MAKQLRHEHHKKYGADNGCLSVACETLAIAELLMSQMADCAEVNPTDLLASLATRPRPLLEFLARHTEIPQNASQSLRPHALGRMTMHRDRLAFPVPNL